MFIVSWRIQSLCCSAVSDAGDWAESADNSPKNLETVVVLCYN